MFPLGRDYNFGGTPVPDYGKGRRTVPIDLDGDTVQMDWDSPTPPTDADIGKWLRYRRTPQAPTPTPTREAPAPVKVDVKRGLAQGAQGIDPTIPDPRLPRPRMPTPVEAVSATGSATGRGMGALVDKPGNLKDALFEGAKGGWDTLSGKGTTSPVAEMQKRSGTKMGPIPEFLLNSAVDIGHVADPMTMLAPAPLMAGAINLPPAISKGAKTAVEVANQARIASMLSGWALPKSLLGNVGAPAVATIENLAAKKGAASFAPIKEAFNLSENLKEFGKGWKKGANPNIAGATGIGKYNPITRTMNAADHATEAALKRSGLTEQEAQRLLLRDPQYGMRGETNPLIDYLVPFKKTPFNVLQGGAKTVMDHPFISAGAGAAGAAVGSQTDDPRALALSTALMGPYSLPYVVGAGLTAGKKALGGLSPIPDWSLEKSIGDPLNPFTAPAFTRMFDEPKQKSGSGTRPLTRGFPSRRLTR